jgi:hypothetical protein
MSEAVPAPAAPPAPPAAPAADAGKTLGIVGLVLAFVFSLAGIIVSAIARSQSKKAGVKNTPATVGLVLGIIFFVIQVIWIIAAIALAATATAGLLDYCAQLGAGDWQLEDGTTISCG